MNLNDYIGKRGENLFRVMITEFCDGQPLFDETFLGEKHPTTDFMVELLGREAGPAPFFVQVKATRSRYRGQGADRKLVVKVDQANLAKLVQIPFPAYVVGVDVDLGLGFLANPKTLATRSIRSISVSHEIDCQLLKKLWREVDE